MWLFLGSEEYLNRKIGFSYFLHRWGHVNSPEIIVKTKFYLWGSCLRLENLGIGTLKTFTLDVRVIAQDWSWISFLVLCLMSACAKWCRKLPHSMQYLKNPLNCRKKQFLCVFLSCHVVHVLNAWPKVCMFSGSSGRKLRTWKRPVWLYNASSFLLMCPLH